MARRRAADRRRFAILCNRRARAGRRRLAGMEAVPRAPVAVRGAVAGHARLGTVGVRCRWLGAGCPTRPVHGDRTMAAHAVGAALVGRAARHAGDPHATHIGDRLARRGHRLDLLERPHHRRNGRWLARGDAGQGGGRRLAELRQRRRRQPLLAACPDRSAQCRCAGPGVDLLARQGAVGRARAVRGDAAQGRRPAICLHRLQRHHRARCRDRTPALALRRARQCRRNFRPDVPRRDLLSRTGRRCFRALRRAALYRDDRQSADRGRRRQRQNHVRISVGAARSIC